MFQYKFILSIILANAMFNPLAIETQPMLCFNTIAYIIHLGRKDFRHPVLFSLVPRHRSAAIGTTFQVSTHDTQGNSGRFLLPKHRGQVECLMKFSCHLHHSCAYIYIETKKYILFFQLTIFFFNLILRSRTLFLHIFCRHRQKKN